MSSGSGSGLQSSSGSIWDSLGAISLARVLVDFSTASAQSPSAFGLGLGRGAFSGAWFNWSGTSDLYFSLLFVLSVVVSMASVTCLLPVRPVFCCCCFLGSAILAADWGGVGFYDVGLGVFGLLNIFPLLLRWCHMS